MAINEAHIKELLNHGERITLECKAAERGLPKSLWETYSAFANTYGGTILLGVEEHREEIDPQKRYTVTNISNPQKLITDFWNLINDPKKVNVNILVDEDVQVINVDEQAIIAIHVPQAAYNVRPIFINDNLQRGVYKRNHEGDYHCTEQEIKLMLRDANEAGNDRIILEHYTMDDIDTPTLERYRQLFKIDHPEHVWNELDNQEFLKQLGGYGVDRNTGIEGLTMAGLLMFGKGLPIRERFDNLRMDYIDKSNLIGEQRYSDRLTYDGTWENNLFNFIRIVLPRLTKDLPRPFAMDGVERKDDTPQHKAIREAMTNAIIHADFMLNGILKIEKTDDAFIFTNPGLLKLPIEQIYAGGESKARNQRIQNMLRMIGYGENIGSGFPLILSAWNEKHWIKPELIEQTELMQVKLVLHILNEDVPQSVPQGVPQDVPQTIIELIYNNPNITREDIAKQIMAATNIDSRATILGHVQRGGRPSVRDRVMASYMGNAAVELLRQGIGNRVICYDRGEIFNRDIYEALQMKKPFNVDGYRVADTISL